MSRVIVELRRRCGSLCGLSNHDNSRNFECFFSGATDWVRYHTLDLLSPAGGNHLLLLRCFPRLVWWCVLLEIASNTISWIDISVVEVCL